MGIYTLSDSLGQSGGAIEWVCSKGDKYKVSLLTLERQSKFERILERKAIESVRELKDLIDKEEYSYSIKECLKSISNGDYCFGGDKCSASLKTFWGITNLLALLVGVDPDKASQLIQENEEISDLIETVVKRSFPVANGSVADEKKT